MIDVIEPADLLRCPNLLTSITHLNNAHALELSWADEARIRWLIEEAFSAERVGTIDAFLIAFDQDSSYDGANYLWFKSRYETFVYVDRIVTHPRARGEGLAKALYGSLVIKARAAFHRCIVCEVNCTPPNRESAALHAALGFRAVGRRQLLNGKAVEYLELGL